MNDRFSVSDAMFFAISYDKASGHFRRLAMAYILIKLLLFVVAIAILYQFIAPIFEGISSFSDLKSSAFLEQFNLISNVSSLSGILILPVFLAIVTSFYRWTLKDDWKRSWFGLRFGIAELNLFVVYIVIYGIFILAIVIFMIPALALAFGVAAVTDTGDGPNVALVVLVSILAGFAFLAGLFWLGIKLSLTLALTARDGRIVIFESFTETKGHFWKLFGSYILLYLVAMVAGMIVMLVSLIVAVPFVVAGINMVGMSPAPQDYGTIAALAATPILVATVLSFFWEYWFYVSIYGISSYFLRWKEQNKVSASTKEHAPAPAEIPVADTAKADT